MSARGIPAQDLPENQDPGTAYVLNEQTGERTPLAVPTPEVEDEKPKRGRPKKKAESELEQDTEPEPSED